MSSKTGFSLVIILLGLMLLRPWKAGDKADLSDQKPEQPAQFIASASAAAIYIEPPEPSPLITEFHSSSSDIQADLEILHTILGDYRLNTREGNPVGSNLEITSALSGNNRHNLAPIPRDHRSISDMGELLDRYGTPYFFHSYSSEYLEIRSAGPDGKHHTADDVSLSNLPEGMTVNL